MIAGGIPILMTGNGFIDMSTEDTRGVMTFVFGNSANGALEIQGLTFSDMATGVFNSRITGFMGNENYSNFLNGVFESFVPLAQTELLQKFLVPYQQLLMNALNPLVSQFQSVDQLTAALVKYTGSFNTGFNGEMMCMKFYV